MKRILLLMLGIYALADPLHAQLANLQIKDSKQLDGGVTVELTASPFDPNYSLLAPGYFRARIFFTEQTAFRLGIWGNVLDNQIAPESVENSWLVSLRPGFEYRFEGSGSTTPYVALDGVIDMQNSTFSSTVSPSVTGALDANGRNRSYWQAGLHIAAGMDYLISDHFYIGMEVGFQYAYRKNAEILVGGVLSERGTTTNLFNTVFSNSLRVGFKLF